MWLWLADRMHCSLAECQARVSSSELTLWKVWREELPNRFDPIFYYLAQIAATCAGPYTKKPPTVQEMLITFSHSKNSIDSLSGKDLEKARESSKSSKSAWMGLLGMTPTGEKINAVG